MNRLVIVGVAVVGGAFMLGRYTAPVKTVEIESISQVKTEKKDSLDKTVIHRRTVSQIATDGVKTTTIDEIIANNLTVSEQKSQVEEHLKARVSENPSRIRLQAFFGIPFGDRVSYGLGASYRILGPISVGAGYMQKQPLLLTIGLDL